MAQGIYLERQTYFKELFFLVRDLIYTELTTPSIHSAICAANRYLLSFQYVKRYHSTQL